jgi:hypothetical protein
LASPPLTAIKGLHLLALDETGLTDSAVLHLKKPANLKTLTLRGTAIGDAALGELRNGLPGCTIEPAPI